MNIREMKIPEQFGSLYVCPIPDSSRNVQHETAHALLQSAVKDYVQTEEDLLLAYHEYQKPYLRDYPELHFNLSHCNGLAVCLISEFECGVDVEPCRKIRPAVVRRVFTDKEQELLSESSDSDQMFTKLWTLKEAYVKAIGRGIGFPMQNVEFQFEGNRIICNREEAEFFQISYEEYQISLCILQSGV